jgi:hypothetical protein
MSAWEGRHLLQAGHSIKRGARKKGQSPAGLRGRSAPRKLTAPPRPARRAPAPLRAADGGPPPLRRRRRPPAGAPGSVGRCGPRGAPALPRARAPLSPAPRRCPSGAATPRARARGWGRVDGGVAEAGAGVGWRTLLEMWVLPGERKSGQWCKRHRAAAQSEWLSGGRPSAGRPGARLLARAPLVRLVALCRASILQPRTLISRALEAKQVTPHLWWRGAFGRPAVMPRCFRWCRLALARHNVHASQQAHVRQARGKQSRSLVANRSTSGPWSCDPTSFT